MEYYVFKNAYEKNAIILYELYNQVKAAANTSYLILAHAIVIFS